MSMRIIHYFMMYIFICFMLIHIYLANIEGISPTLLMFFWKEHGGLVYDPEPVSYTHLEERVDIWMEIAREHPSLRGVNRVDLVRLSSGMPRYDIYLSLIHI